MKRGIKDIESISEEPYGDRRQELVLIGTKMDKETIIHQLDDCLLNDQELALGYENWIEWDDPFSDQIEEAEMATI
jgi:hypothetical protein